jgi:type III secretory pathway lipoprotein EscJ
MALLPALLGLACFLNGCGEKSVAKVSSESDAIEIIDVLRENNLEADKEEVGEGEAARWNITIDEGLLSGGQASRATQVLHYYGLPRTDERKAKGEDNSVFPSPSAENDRRLRERETEMERKLRLLPGVARVNVTIVLPDSDSIKLDPYPATASVLIVYKYQTPAFTGEQVQNQVAGGVPGLKPEKVIVSMSYEPPPPIPQQDPATRRLNNIILAAVIGFGTILCFLLGAWLLHMRRQRALSQAPDEGEEPEAEDEGQPTPALSTGDKGRLGAEPSGTGSGARELQAGVALGDSTTVK